MNGRKKRKQESEDDKGVGGSEGNGNNKKLLAISKRESRQAQIEEYLRSLDDCNPEIANMRKVHRCWSRKVTCSVISDRDFDILKKHGQLQMKAREIYRKVNYPCSGCYWKYKSENNVYFSEISSGVKGRKDVTFQNSEEFFAHRKKMGYPPGSGWSDLVVVDGPRGRLNI